MTEGTEKETEQEAKNPAAASPGGETEGDSAAEPPPARESEEETPEKEVSSEEASSEEARAEEVSSEEAEPAATLEAQLAEHKDKHLRAMAEMENVRRRAGREREDAAKYAIANFAREILQVADNLRRAVESVDGESRKKDEALENLCAGVEMTERIMLAAFEKVGIRPIEAQGARFDHNLHEAMFEVENPDLPAGTVVQVMRNGYLLHDRLLRPVQVGVSRGGPKADPAAAAQSLAPTPAPAPADKQDPTQAYEKPAKNTGANLDEEL